MGMILEETGDYRGGQEVRRAKVGGSSKWFCWEAVETGQSYTTILNISKMKKVNRRKPRTKW